MTDKEKILAKIESLLNETNYEPFTDEVFGRIQTLKELKSYIDSLQKEPASDGLEEEITKCYKSRNDLMMTRKQFGELIHRFTNWQHGKDFDDLLQSEMKFPKEYYERGRSDMRNEMLKNTILETKVMMDSDGDGIEIPYEEWITLENTEIPYIPDNLGLKEGNRVKIIIVKTEQ